MATNTLWEAFLVLLRTAPYRLAGLLLALLQGRPKLKRYLATHAPIDPDTLPYREEVLDEMRQARRDGRQVLLVTASDQAFADAVAEHVGLFDESLGSDGQHNLKARRKAELLVSRFGDRGFQYIGDASADVPVWRAAGEAIIVAPSPRTLRKAKQAVPEVKLLSMRPEKWKAVLKQLRPHQWAKNLLLFVPLFFAHKYTDAKLVFTALMAFFAFSFAASSIYVLNDLVDLPLDRGHRNKRNRPLASGSLAIPEGILLASTSLVLAFAMAFVFVNPKFALVLVGYIALTTVYTFNLKRRLIVDVLTLAMLFTYRVMAGGVAVQVELSFWLLAFSIFFFTSLAFVKRYSELVELDVSQGGSVRGRNYVSADLPIITAVGPASGLLAVLVFALYINSPSTLTYYSTPKALWGICLILMYWVARIWFLAGRRELHEDPVLFAVRDKLSLVSGILVVVCVLAARF